MQLNLTRPLLFFDIESTGLNIPEDSIVELSFVKVFPGGEERVKTWRIKAWDYIRNRQRPMNPDASKVNGITDDMLTDCPTFFELAEEVASWVADSDLAGFNSAKFDLPMLAEEFERVKLAGKDLHVDLHSPLMVDVQNIFHTMEPRNLRAAYRFYCGGEDFENAHSAEADTLATYEVLKAQLDRYKEPDKYREQVLKNDVNALASFVGKKYVDFSGHLILDDKGEVLINFGKHKGKTARMVWETEPSYFAWIQQGTFTLDTKAQFAKLEEQYKRERLAAKWNGKLF
ncbi:MAG: 3'-5' exonuclease [Bacteroidales bacterium]|nr:3'-5' exonuclease [Bacteroidales bacterium]